MDSNNKNKIKRRRFNEETIHDNYICLMKGQEKCNLQIRFCNIQNERKERKNLHDSCYGEIAKERERCFFF